MSQLPLQPLSWSHVVETLRKRFWLWALPTLVGTVLGAAAAVLQRPTWQASQALVVRDEAVGNMQRQGRFDNLDTMKASQETVLEVARNRTVVRAALKALGPQGESAEGWPTEAAVRDLQKRITVSAPRGAEFGKTEVIYLSVTGYSPQQAIERTQAVCDQLEQHLAALRNARAESLIAELARTAQLAQTDLDQATQRLEHMERELGSDLGELRTLNDAVPSDGTLRTVLNQLEAELRQAHAQFDVIQNQRSLLEAARNDPNQLVATPTSLLESQLALKRLKEGLVDAQLRTAGLLGNRSPEHPSVIAARRAEDRVRQDIYQELEMALRGIDAEASVKQSLIATLQSQRAEVRGRLDRLAGLRARYGNLVSDLSQRTAILEKAKRDLSEARASQSAAQSVSLITRFQTPTSGHDPVSPSRASLLLGGFAGGLFSGLGLVVLTWPRSQVAGRRWSDLLRFGRRASDQVYNRRVADHLGTPPRPVSELHRRAEDGARPVFSEHPRRSSEPVSGPRPIVPVRAAAAAVDATCVAFSMPDCSAV